MRITVSLLSSFVLTSNQLCLTWKDILVIGNDARFSWRATVRNITLSTVIVTVKAYQVVGNNKDSAANSICSSPFFFFCNSQHFPIKRAQDNKDRKIILQLIVFRRKERELKCRKLKKIVSDERRKRQGQGDCWGGVEDRVNTNSSV